MKTIEEASQTYRPTSRQWMLLGALLFVETMLWQQFILALVLIVFGVASSLRRYVRERGRSKPFQYHLPVAYLVAGLVCFGLFYFNNNVWGPAMAERIAIACDDYRAENGSYPQELDDLTPTHLRMIPPAKLTILWSGFHYNSHGENPFLLWVAIPPFGRPTYDIADREMGYLD